MENNELITSEEGNNEENKEEKVSENASENETEIKEAKPKKVIDVSKGGLIWSVWNFLEAALIFALGIICFVYTAQAQSKATDGERTLAYVQVISTIILIAGIFLIIGGALKIIVNFLPIVGKNVVDAKVKAAIKSQLSYDLVIGGSIELAAGIALIVAYNKFNGALEETVGVITTFLAVFAGVLLIIAGVSLILFAVGFIVSKLYKIYLPIVEIIFGAALLTLGIVVLCFLVGNTGLTSMIALIILGIILVLAGIAMAIMTVVEIHKAKLKKAAAVSKENSEDENVEVVENPEVVDAPESNEEKSENESSEENKAE